MKKIFLLGIVLMIASVTIVGCSKNQYNATIINGVEDWLQDDFLRENRVKAFYLNDNYVEGQTIPSDKYIRDTTSPSSRTVIISTQNEFDEKFINHPFDVDFDNEIIILYFFGDEYPNRDYKIEDINLDEQTLNIYIELENDSKKDAVMSYQRCILVKLKKTDFKTVNFIKTN